MKYRLFLAGTLVILAAAGTWAQDSGVLDDTRKLKSQFTADGVQVTVGMAVDGTQNLAVLAKNGYFPLQYQAKAGVRSVLRVYTDKTFDCGRSFFLPDLKLRAVLPPKGVTEFAVPPLAKGATLFGTCGMGMYTFEIRFE